MNIDDLRSSWQAMGASSATDMHREAIEAARGSARSSADRLRAQYLIMSCFALLAPLIFAGALCGMGMPHVYIWCFAGFFILMAAFMLTVLALIPRTRMIDTAPALAIARRVRLIRRLRVMQKCVGIPLAAMLVAWMVTLLVSGHPDSSDDALLLTCVALGAVAGICIGLWLNARAARILDRLDRR